MFQVRYVIDVISVGVKSLIIFLRQCVLKILEIFRYKFPPTRREELQDAETNINFLLYTNHESRLEENQHEEIDK